MIFLYTMPFIIGFIFALFVPIDFFFRIEWFLFGLEFNVDVIAKQFLFFTSFVWLISAFYAFYTITQEKKQYFFWFILTFVGNYFLCFSFDVISFYILFSLMSISSFGLILHTQTHKAKQAAFVYIKYAIFGEIIIFIGIVSLVFHFGSFNFYNFTNSQIIFAHLLILIGFGIKVGVFLLHSWLPLAHTNAPASASAVLSAVMLKAGVLGWLRFFNETLVYEQMVVYALMIAGVLGILIGFYGLFQDKLKAILAYSSISQMGFVVMMFSLAMYDTSNYQAIITAISFFIIHHAFNKAAIFLLANEIKRSGLNILNLFIFFVASLSLIGLPFTSGALAKKLFKEEIHSSLFLVFLTMGSIITAMLMIRFYLLSKEYTVNKTITKESVIITPLVMMSLLLAYIHDFTFSFSVWQFLPLLIAVVFFLIIVKNNILLKLLPQGDLLHLLPPFPSFEKKIEKSYYKSTKLFYKTKLFFVKVEKTLHKQHYVFFLAIMVLLIWLIIVVF